MKHLPIETVYAVEEKTSYLNMLHTIFTAMLMIIGGMLSLAKTMDGLNFTDFLLPFLMTVVVFVILFVARAVSRRNSYYKAVFAVLLFATVIYFGIRGFFLGFEAWINSMIMRWNTINNGGLALFNITATYENVMAFIDIVSVVMGITVYFMISQYALWTGVIYCLFWVFIQLISGAFNIYSSALLMTGLIALFIHDSVQKTTLRGLLWTTAAFIVFFTGAAVVSQQNIVFVDTVRKTVDENIHNFRYGKDVFVQGDLRKAAKLKENKEDMLSVSSAEDKVLYLKAFVGGEYSDGKWNVLSDSEYGGDNSGMLKWLKEQGFDPLTQSADYYSLCEKNDDIPQENSVSVETINAPRNYIYSTASTLNFKSRKIKEKKDTCFVGRGFMGAKNYTFSETSSVEPSELTVAQSWIGNPQTEEQKQYCLAESVYRNFVYTAYTHINRNMYESMNELFWDDYDTDSDGIYSLLTNIRKKLKDVADYVELPEEAPEGEDPILYFINYSHEANSVLYAAAATEAFRAYGIPARYVEGYYVPASKETAENGKNVVTGENSHAWVEVYFDGIGWMPVDVTPGYYYDAVALQQMVSTPENLNKTAALQNNDSSAKQIVDPVDDGKNILSDTAQAAKNVALICLGIVAFLFIAVVIIAVSAEFLRLICLLYVKKKYNNYSAEEKAVQIEKWIYYLLGIYGINARLGWKTKEIDEELSQKIDGIKKDEYSRVCSIIEKSVYGAIPPEPFEERTLSNFLKKILDFEKKNSLYTRFKIRYSIILSRV